MPKNPSPPAPLPEWERGEKQMIAKRGQNTRQVNPLSRARAGVMVPPFAARSLTTRLSPVYRIAQAGMER